MTETVKTLIYAAVAAASLLVAWFVNRPVTVVDSIDEDLRKPFFADFKDPLAAKTLDIQEFDDKTAELIPFKVTQVNGVWSLPSHENYPADADRQLVEAAASLIDVKKLNWITDDRSQHETYGVVDPDPKTLTPGAQGVGKRVTLTGADGKRLADFIIGKADDKDDTIRYVRIPGQDRVYSAKISVDKLSTRFEDWIEKDLLKMNAFDVEQLVINDYNVDELNNQLNMRGEFTLDYDNEESKWALVDRRVYDEATNQMQSVPLTTDEEVNTQKLNDMKTALDDLQIVDVVRKPAGLSADLRADPEQFSSAEAKRSLAQKGFFVLPGPNGTQIYSNEGEVRCGLSTGVEYVLRFGNIAGRGREAEPDASGAAAAASGANRYVFLTCLFNEDLIAKPELEEMPSGAPADKDAGNATQAPSEGAATQTSPAGDAPEATVPEPSESVPTAEEPTSDAPSTTEPSTTEQSASEQNGGGADQVALAQAEPAEGSAAVQPTPEDAPAQPASEAAEPAELATSDAATAAEPASATANATEPSGEPAAETAAEAAATTDAAVTTNAAATAEEKPATMSAEDLERERRRVEDDNTRKQREYDDKVKEGQKAVGELNDRFADWYFVISDETYQKIRLRADDIITKKAPPEIKPDDNSLDPFKGGLEGLNLQNP